MCNLAYLLLSLEGDQFHSSRVEPLGQGLDRSLDVRPKLTCVCGSRLDCVGGTASGCSVSSSLLHYAVLPPPAHGQAANEDGTYSLPSKTVTLKAMRFSSDLGSLFEAAPSLCQS